MTDKNWHLMEGGVYVRLRDGYIEYGPVTPKNESKHVRYPYIITESLKLPLLVMDSSPNSVFTVRMFPTFMQIKSSRNDGDVEISPQMGSLFIRSTGDEDVD